MDRRVEPAQPIDDIVDTNRSEGGEEFVGVGVGAGEGDVVPHDAGEQERLLGHDTELASKTRDRDIAQIVPIDTDRAVVGVVEAGQQFCNGRLA